MTTPAAKHVLILDPTACDGRGLCAEAVPGLVDLDEWGFPLLPGGGLRADIAGDRLGEARDAVHACPALALHLERAPPQRR
ncbi:MAG: ferredoxin [Candidatus Nanopelagicales bacterium]